ncbi:hypothetical protein GCM10010156_73260 [Planobispora rosea]|uniref:Uncharacterized protein n=1 Tax=Planobispora rosea TaxID=35762 RepID=A0A8J3SAC8_PLARO|nr:hypothetical protein [Planobispora rosea]GGT04842.1 hypothetical protein GCM10010156_73260 [Planobispora rosea]GIH88926.1 hypothetical protein Pro02_73340 [Planobispora rosea]
MNRPGDDALPPPGGASSPPGGDGRGAGRVQLHCLVLRALVWAAGTAVLLVAMPPDYRAGPVMPLLAVLLGLLTAADPDGGWVPATQAVTVVAWLLTTLVYGYAPSPAMGLLIGLLLYLHHGMAAIAARIPASARVPATLLAPWLARTGAVTVASAAVCLALAAITGAAGSAVPAAVAVVLGAAGALTLARVLRDAAR